MPSPDPAYRPDPRWLQLGEGFGDAVRPADFPRTDLRWRDDRAAATVGLASLDDAAWLAHFARFEPLPDNLPTPLALRYHGHQFGHYNPDLGDGRGFLFAQLRDEADRLLDLGTKGSGTTPWSRGGDGKLTLQGGVREVLAAELLAALGLETCRILSLVETGEALWRGDEDSPTRSAVLVRLSHSHVRFGTFQRLALHGDKARIQRLLAYCTEHLVPVVDDSPSAFLREVARRKGVTTARWMVAGFVHGVLNTDNMNVTGESFDYGPWRFLPTYDPGLVAAYFDHAARYAFGRQPSAVKWNLLRLAEALSLVEDRATLEAATEAFEPALEAELRLAMTRRLGIVPRGAAEDDGLLNGIFAWLRDSGLPFDRLFFDWYGGPASAQRARAGAWGTRYAGRGWKAIEDQLQTYEPRWPERLAAPILGRPGPPHLHIDLVRELWADIAEHDDWAPLYAHLDRIRQLGALYAP